MSPFVDRLLLPQHRLYPGRSKTSPTKGYTGQVASPHDPFVEFAPDIIRRLAPLTIEVTPDDLQGGVTPTNPVPRPFSKGWTEIDCGLGPLHNPILTHSLLDRDISPLHEARLHTARTELPWRNMVNPAPFTLGRTLPGGVSVRLLLDFFASPPHLRTTELHSATSTSGPIGITSLPSKDGHNPGFLKVPLTKRLSLWGTHTHPRFVSAGARASVRASHPSFLSNIMVRPIDRAKFEMRSVIAMVIARAPRRGGFGRWFSGGYFITGGGTTEFLTYCK